MILFNLLIGTINYLFIGTFKDADMQLISYELYYVYLILNNICRYYDHSFIFDFR